MKQCNSLKKLSICCYWAFAVVAIRSHHPSHSSVILVWLPVPWHCHQLVFFHCSSHHAPSVLNMAALSSSQTSSYGVSQGSVLGPLLFIMYTAPRLITLALSLMNISPLTKSQHFLNPAILLFVHFVVSVLDEEKQPVPSPHPLSILNLTTATPFYHNLPNS